LAQVRVTLLAQVVAEVPVGHGVYPPRGAGFASDRETHIHPCAG
jgi:hypothetical protein